MRNERPIPFAKLAQNYLRTLDLYHEAKTAANVSRRIGKDSRDLEYHAAEVQAQHQEAVTALVSAAVQLREQGKA